MPQLAKQLRFEDDYKEPLMFYAAKSSPVMFEAVQKLVRDTIGEVGLTEQLRHRSARGIDILMKSCNDPITFGKVWDLLDQADCLEELLRDARDKDGKSWIHHAAEAGNRAAFPKLDNDLSSLLKEFSSEDSKGWSGVMYAARGQHESNESFLEELCGHAKPADDPDFESQLKEQLTRIARDSDKSTLLMHAAIGGRKQFDIVRSLMCRTGCDVWSGKHDTTAMLLSWASKGGDIDVFERVAQGIKVGIHPIRYSHFYFDGLRWCSGGNIRAPRFNMCVFFPSILDIKFVGRTSRGHTGGRSHRIFNPPSFCGACLDFCREKDSYQYYTTGI